MTIHRLAPHRAAHRSLLWLILVVLLGATGCTHRDLIPPANQLLKTRITADGLKLFELDFPMRPAPEGVQDERVRRKPRPEASAKHLQSVLEEVMLQMQYCRQGYVLLGRYAGETTRRLRGECNDRATEEDRRRFPDTIARW